MTKLVRMPYHEFRANIDAVVDSVIANGDAVVVELVGRPAVILHLEEMVPDMPIKFEKMTPEAFEAFKWAAGSWADVDTEALIARIYADRESSKPPIEL